MYDRYRLEDEGVVNVQALVHHDLVELMLATRIPVPRLVDWVDQGIFRLHVGGTWVKHRRRRVGRKERAEHDEASDTAPVDRSMAQADLARLGALAIRTATDLERVCEAAATLGRAAYHELLRALEGEDPQPHTGGIGAEPHQSRSPDQSDEAVRSQRVYRFEVVRDAMRETNG